MTFGVRVLFINSLMCDLMMIRILTFLLSQLTYVAGGIPSGYLSIVTCDRTDAVFVYFGYASQNIMTPGELLHPDSFYLRT